MVGWQVYAYFVRIEQTAVRIRLGLRLVVTEATGYQSSGFCTVGFGRQKDVRQKMNAGEFPFFATYFFAILFGDSIGDTPSLWHSIVVSPRSMKSEA